MYNRLVAFLEKFQILNNSQHGFRRRLSTESAAITRLQFVYDHLDSGEYVVGIFFDLSRAFDSLQPEFVKQKLFRLGVRGTVLDWFLSFLTDRTMNVVLGGAVSAGASVDLGVAQGSVLGPIIFLLFINDLPDFINDAHVVMYADDTSIAVAAQDPETLALRVAQVVAQFHNWCKNNRILLNVQKTVYVNFHSRRPVQAAVLENGVLSQEVNFLGIRIDSRLVFDKHIDSVCGSLNRCYFALLKLKASLGRASVMDAYYALCHSRLAYGCLLWGESRDWRRVFVSQKRIVRLLFDLPNRESCRPYFKRHSLLTFPCIFIYKAVLYVRQNINDFPRNNRPYNTRHLGFSSVRHRTALYERSPRYSFIRLYNRLPESVTQLPTYGQFKHKVREILVRGGYYSQQEYLDDVW